MKCDEVHDLAGDVLDRGLSPRSAAEFHRHLKMCPPCRREFELELVTKNTIRNTIPPAPTPPTTRHAVLDLIASERRAIGGRLNASLRFGRRLLGVPVIAGGAALLAFGYFASVRAPQTPWPGREGSKMSIVNVAEENLARARQGTLRPTVVTAEAQEVGRFFRRHGAHFASAVAPPSRGEWYGATLTYYGGMQLAHLVCRIGDDSLYVFEIQEDDVRRGAELQLPVSVIDGIARRGWFSDRGLGGDAVVFWRENETLCAASSTMKPQELLAILALREGK